MGKKIKKAILQDENFLSFFDIHLNESFQYCVKGFFLSLSVFEVNEVKVGDTVNFASY